MPSENLFTILLRERDRGSCAAQNAHVPEYIPLFVLRFVTMTPLTHARYRSQTGSEFLTLIITTPVDLDFACILINFLDESFYKRDQAFVFRQFIFRYIRCRHP
jgi:hypothetical protein